MSVKGPFLTLPISPPAFRANYTTLSTHKTLGQKNMRYSFQKVTRLLSLFSILIGILCISGGCKDTPPDHSVDSDSSGGGKEAMPRMNAPSVVLDDGRRVTVTEFIPPIEYEAAEDTVETTVPGSSAIKTQ